MNARAQRFWDKVSVRDGCWEWQAYRRKDGYGWFAIGEGNSVLAHRWAFETTNGRIPSGLDLDHLCRNRSCVRPDHLEPVTRAVNCQRGDTGRHNAIKTHCPRGHEYDEVNTYADKRGSRDCRACRRERQRQRKAVAS